MRVLFSTGSSAKYMEPPLLGDEQVNCGPDWEDVRGADGRYLSMATPLGRYDLAALADRLPVSQRPDLVVCLVDASWRNLPGNLSRFKCPRVLLIADTHHMRKPLLGMLQYAMSEPYTRIVLVYDRHHAAFFRAAGIRNLYWFPGITFPYRDAVVRAARQRQRTSRIAFVGQAGRYHPRRQRLFPALKSSGLPFEPKLIPQSRALGWYGASTIGLNVSLNGDLNLRVFEILASGAALLTDRLAPDSGMDLLFPRGEEVLVYGSGEELIERARWATVHPDEARALGEKGAEWFDRHFNAARRGMLFRALAVDGRAPDAFPCPTIEAGRTIFPGGPGRVIPTTVFYEALQNRHREMESVRVAVDATVPAHIRTLCGTLPRVRLALSAAGAGADVMIASAGSAPASLAGTNRVWFWDAAPKQIPVLAEAHRGLGWRSSDDNSALFRRVIEPTGEDRAKHILLYTDDAEAGGVAQYNHAILLGLVEAGYRVTCVQSPSESPLVAEQRARGVVHKWLGYDASRQFDRTLSDSDRAEDYFCDDRPDLIFFSDCCPVSNIAARELALRYGIPYVIAIGFVAPYLATEFQPVLPDLARHFAGARDVIAVSQDNLELLRRHFGLPHDRGRVIYYGRPATFFEPRNAAVRARLREEHGIAPDAVVCLTTARLTKLKGYWEQLRAIELLRATSAFEKLVFVWLGDGPDRTALEKEIAGAGLERKVLLLGHRWDVADWYDAADIFVLPSHAEGMPLSIMEAMAKGLPVVASAVSGIPEELGSSGALIPDPSRFPPDIPAALARVLERWAGDPQERERVSCSARTRADEMFRVERMIGETRNCLYSAMTVYESFAPAGRAAATLAENIIA